MQTDPTDSHEREMTETAQLALRTLMREPQQGIPAWQINPMEWRMIDRLAGVPDGQYQRDPTPTYHKMLVQSGCCLLDQWIPDNPLSMGTSGYDDHTPRTATTGAEIVVADGIRIDSPEAVVDHLERFEFPRLAEAIRTFDEAARADEIVQHERDVQDVLGPSMLKTPYGHVDFPKFSYSLYGYEYYFMAYALYPEVMARQFALQADLAVLRNRAFVIAFQKGALPPLTRLDFDMADSRSTLVDIDSLDRIWFPQFDRSIAPVRDAGIPMIWHCDGDLSAMVPRLLDVGLSGFQGFQYEDGMDYEAICRMTTRDGEPLIIIAGVSVTRTLPYGTPDDVRREMQWLVDHGPKTGLFLGGSSSITPGVPLENLQALTDGFHHYRQHGRS